MSECSICSICNLLSTDANRSKLKLSKIVFFFGYEPDLKHTNDVSFERAVRSLRSIVIDKLNENGFEYVIDESSDEVRIIAHEGEKHFLVNIGYNIALIVREGPFISSGNCKAVFSIIEQLLRELGNELVTRYNQNIDGVGIEASYSFIMRNRYFGPSSGDDRVSVLINIINEILNSSEEILASTISLSLEWSVKKENTRYRYKIDVRPADKVPQLALILNMPLNTDNTIVSISLRTWSQPKDNNIINLLRRIQEEIISETEKLYETIKDGIVRPLLIPSLP